MALWVHASSRWNRVTLGLASASLCWYHQRLAVRLKRCHRLPGIAMYVSDTVVADGQVALEQ